MVRGVGWVYVAVQVAWSIVATYLLVCTIVFDTYKAKPILAKWRSGWGAYALRSVLPVQRLWQIIGTKNRLPSLSLLICTLIKTRKNEHYSY